MRILAIDPAIRNTGFAIIEGDHQQHRALSYDVISIPRNLPQSEALAAVRGALSNLIISWLCGDRNCWIYGNNYRTGSITI